MYLLILGAIVYVLSRISKNGFGKPSGLSLLMYLAIGGLGLAFLIAMIEGDSHSSKHDTDGVYESATKKNDEGIPLNDREKKRMDDILNYKDDQRAKDIEYQNGE
jgi:hypothetical protein